jgi:hypothetical protein
MFATDYLLNDEIGAKTTGFFLPTGEFKPSFECLR